MIRLRRLCALALCVLMVLTAAPVALAWKPSTHLHLAQVALKDALDDGKVTIYRVNYKTGQILGPIGDYKVDELTLQALRAHRAEFMAGVLGPDAYPDIHTGQTAIHPLNENLSYPLSAGGSDAWLRHLWQSANDQKLSPDERLPVRAFTMGFLTHAAGDNYAHTYVNHYAGGPFNFVVNAAKHVVLESYIGKHAPAAEREHISAKSVERFILDALVKGEPDKPLMNLLEGNKDANIEERIVRLASVPRTFSMLRAELVKSLRTGEADNSVRLKKTPGWSDTWATYKRAWIVLIDDGLKDWVRLSEAVGEALFHGADMDVKRARQLVKEYNKKHLRKMTHGPVGKKVDEIERKLKGFVPEPVSKAVSKVREKISGAWYGFFKYVFWLFTRKEFDDFVGYYRDPENHIEGVLNSRCRREGDSQRKIEVEAVCIDQKELDRQLGVNRGGDYVFHRDFAPAYNTVVLTKLLLLDQHEINRLLRDLGATAGRGAGPASMTAPNIMLGFNRGLDGDNQWFTKDGEQMMTLVRGGVYDQIFKSQVGEKDGIESYLRAKAGLYALGTALETSAAQTRRSGGLVWRFEQGSVYWSPGNGVRVVQGAILAKWGALGGEGGQLGFPTSDSLRLSGENGDDWYQFFEHGVIYSRAADGTAVVFKKRLDRGEEVSAHAESIRLKAESLGLGEPLTSVPQSETDGMAWWQRFERGYVYWSAEGGAKWLSVPMWDAWRASAEALGSPTTDETQVEGGDEHDRYQFFARGVIYLRRDPDAVRIAYLRP